jgi:hypothetical protein
VYLAKLIFDVVFKDYGRCLILVLIEVLEVVGIVWILGVEAITIWWCIYRKSLIFMAEGHCQCLSLSPIENLTSFRV